MPGYQQMEVHMAHSKREISTVLAIIDKVRTIRGEQEIPNGVCPEVALDTIRLIQRQCRDLFQSGVEIGLRQLTEQVCSAQIFTLDDRVNTVLRYAYQVVAMNYFGKKKTESESIKKLYRASIAAQVISDYERESQK